MMKNDYNRPNPSGLSRMAIDAVAERVSISNGLLPGGSMHKLVDRLGGEIDYDDTVFIVEDNPGTLLVRGKRDFTIILPTITSHLRDNFTLAHELGHYFLHYLYPIAKGTKVDKLIAQRSGSDRVEWEANQFAASLLMPADELRYQYNKWIKSNTRDAALFKISSFFGVSVAALDVRVRLLRLDSENGKDE